MSGRRIAGPAIWPKVILLIVAVSVSACWPGGAVNTGPRETSITGRLGGVPRGEAGCAWILTSAGERIEVVYPNAWHVEFDPVAVFDDGGRQVAGEGNTLIVEGYFSDISASVCAPERSFNATRVTVKR
jgi:hypothetical protein